MNPPREEPLPDAPSKTAPEEPSNPPPIRPSTPIVETLSPSVAPPTLTPPTEPAPKEPSAPSGVERAKSPVDPSQTSKEEARLEHTLATQNHRQFWVTLAVTIFSVAASSILSPIILHKYDRSNQEHNHELDLKNQETLSAANERQAEKLFQLNKEQAEKMQSLNEKQAENLLLLTQKQGESADARDEERHEYALKLQTLTELESAVADYKKARFKYCMASLDFTETSALAVGQRGLLELTHEDNVKGQEAETHLTAEETEARFAAEKVRSVIDKASIVFHHQWLSTEQARFGSAYVASTESDAYFASEKRLASKYHDIISDELNKAKKSKTAFSFPVVSERVSREANIPFCASFLNDFAAKTAIEDALFSQVYFDCVRFLAPDDDAPPVVFSAQPAPSISSPTPKAKQRTQTKAKQ